MRASGKHVVVIGAGIVGATVALRLVQDGHRVTILDPGPPGGPQASSHGNGAFLSPASILPMSSPGLWRKVPGFLMDQNGPLTIRWRHLPRLAPWLWRFVRAGATPARVERIAAALAQLLSGAPDLHLQQARRIGRPDLIRQDGLVYAFANRTAFEAEAFSWNLRQRQGVVFNEMDEAELRRRLPDLSPAYHFGILVAQGAHCLDPSAYVAATVAAATDLGARLVPNAAIGFKIAGGQLNEVRTTAADIACDAAVIAMGAASGPLARAAGDRVPLESERGYHVQIANPGIAPALPVMPQDGRMANTMTAGGLRAAGQVELASNDAAPDWRRADILLGHLRRTWPALAQSDPAQVVSRWQGNRPSTPDGKPVIGPARLCTQIMHAFGHGHVGLASAPMTAEILAAILSGQSPPINITPFSAQRFGWGMRNGHLRG